MRRTLSQAIRGGAEGQELTTLVIDDEPKWIAHCEGQGADTCPTVAAALELMGATDYTRVIVSNRLLANVPALVALGVRVEVATGLPATAEQLRAYGAGAVDYYAKDFRRRLC